MEVNPTALNAIYRACKKENWRCYGLPGGRDNRIPIYGELTQGDFSKIVDCCVYLFGMDKSFRVIDLGSGVGKPSWHFAQLDIEASVGVESEYERYISSLVVQDKISKVPPADLCERVCFLHADVLRLTTLSQFDIIYMFDCGFTDELYRHLASIVGGRARYMVSYRAPDYLQSYGFEIVLLGALSGAHMSGSTNTRTAYFYSVSPSPTYNPHVVDPSLETALYMCHALHERKRHVAEQIHIYLNGN
jgi:hypothetical protein